MADRGRKGGTEGAKAAPQDALRAAAGADEPGHHGVLAVMREWADALVFAFVLAMFIRMFVVELFKIPSGSMTPALLGDFIAEGVAADANRQSGWYLIVADRGSDTVQVWRRNNREDMVYEGRRHAMALTASQRELLNRGLHLEEHRIFVNKFAYWFRKPDRGDVAVFRVPFQAGPSTYERNGHAFTVKPFNRHQAVYVKRVAAFGGEHVEMDPEGRLLVDGAELTEPRVFTTLRYNATEYTPGNYSVTVPEGQVVMLGDNSDNSEDSRYWGGVPYENLRGKAFFRYWPVRKWSFLNP